MIRQKKRAATIHDVAREAGVSVSTVSRVLNRKDDVAFETRQKVDEVISRLGYASSLAARGMRSNTTHVVGVIMPDIGSAYCSEIMQGINQAIAHSNYDVIIFSKGDISKYGPIDQQRLTAMLLNGDLIDGLIVVAPAKTSSYEGLPVVVIDPNVGDINCPSIISTNYEAARQATDYLIGLGHRRIAHITGRLELVSSQERLRGYRDSLESAGIPVDETLILTGDYTIEIGFKCARELLTLPHPPTAIFGANDMTAFGIYQAARELGLKIPQDLSVVGFDNIEEARFAEPPLTTVDQAVIHMGNLATEILFKLLEGEEVHAQTHPIPTKFVIRESCCAI